RRRLSVRPGAQSPIGRRVRSRTRHGGRAEPKDGKTREPLQGLFLAAPRQLEQVAPGYRQGGVDQRGGQSALHRHLAGARGAPSPPPVREDLLRPRRHGKPHQGVPARSLRRSHLGSDDARQPVAPVARGRWPTCWSAPCVASASNTPSSPQRPARRSGSSCSKSALSCALACAASNSPCHRPFPTRPSTAPPIPLSPRSAPEPRQRPPPITRQIQQTDDARQY